MLVKDQSLLVVVDVQGKLSQIVYNSKTLLDNISKIIQGVQVLEIPIVWLEQCPEKLGETNPKIGQYLKGLSPLRKVTFNACENEDFISAIRATGRRQVLLTGLETHICVYQTAVGLKKIGYDVQVIADAVSSQTLENREIALDKMKGRGIELSSVEMALFEMMHIADGKKFKRILEILKVK
jgi:hypothetical protein